MTPAWVAAGDRLLGFAPVTDALKPGAADAVAELHRQGIDVWLVTGDEERTARAIAKRVGIPADRVMADVLPADKAAAVSRLQAEGRTVAMVGDGINDAPAIAAADLGIAIGTGADIAIEAADVTLVGGDPRAVADALALSRATMAVIRQNLFWAFAYNVVLIPVADGRPLPDVRDHAQPSACRCGDGAVVGVRSSPTRSGCAVSTRGGPYTRRCTSTRTRRRPRLTRAT
jgi:Cu+-exporting ATPase